MSETIAVSIVLTADPRNLRQARQVLRGALLRSGAGHLIDPATLVLSDMITNAFLHAGTVVRLHLWSTDMAVRVEVEHVGAHLPSQRGPEGAAHASQQVAALTDRRGTEAHGKGGVAWFELGEFDAGRSYEPDTAGPRIDHPGGVKRSPPESSIATSRR
jgi:hypothetical protein